MLACQCDKELIIRLLNKTSPDHLETENVVGDTALHVAVANNQVEVATIMMEMNIDLVHQTNNKGETPLHKSAFFGHTASFRKLIEKQSDPWVRTQNGSNVLHCAIMGNNPGIPLKNSTAINVGKEHEGNRDVEKQGQSSPYNDWVKDEIDSDEVLQEKPWTKTSRKFPAYRKVFRYLRIKIVNVTDLWMRPLLINILKKLSNRVKELEELKIKHAQNLKLVAYMARKPDYWDFVVKGMFRKKTEMDFGSEGFENDNSIEEDVDDESDDDFNGYALSPFTREETRKEEMGQQEFLKKLSHIMVEFGKHVTDKKVKGPTRWYESPLIVGAQMGFYDFVEQILKACPESAQYKDLEGKNVLQVAITHGHEKIVKIIINMITRSNPMLPSSLLSDQDNKAKNTILHYAAETTIDDEGPPMQMFYELKWFERVEKLVPKDMLYSINMGGRTGQELFKEKHIDMVKSGKQQLMELGKTCASLMAAVVFASSFSIPGEKDNNHNPVFIHRAAFKGTRLPTISSNQIFTGNRVLFIGFVGSSGSVHM
ncbi:hypothetical protein J5N97_022383 [Dioscorea zingiberensis]|uniref:Uncharacterized protein n=1 Tax=Dioscorea zingiberensis TaxID=325984 RepID=A0A9D5CAG8_9LILI|nr:hypothetical protein J5N97_022383 [Dioscorea zingiberensis]